MTLLTVYAKKERSNDKITNTFFPNHKKNDVVIYKDKDCKEVFCRWAWYYTSCPTRRNKYVTLNCYKWKLEWVEEEATK